MHCLQTLANVFVLECLAQLFVHLTVQIYVETGHSDNETDFISALTGLLKDIATAVEENHDLLLTNFGATFLVQFTLGLQAECDVQVCQSTA